MSSATFAKSSHSPRVVWRRVRPPGPRGPVLESGALPVDCQDLPIVEDGTIDYGPADDRPVETIAVEIARTTPELDQGDGGTPADLDDDLRGFVATVTGAGGRERDRGWLSGLREYVVDAGPVPSSRFL
jgi:hypothetical protein